MNPTPVVAPAAAEDAAAALVRRQGAVLDVEHFAGPRQRAERAGNEAAAAVGVL
jgi:hypothetical protein